MERPVKGDIVIVPYPFSNLTNVKRRPALVVAELDGQDCIICQISSSKRNKYSISLETSDMAKGKLRTKSNILTNKVVTVKENIILYKVGKVKNKKIQQVQRELVEIFTQQGL